MPVPAPPAGPLGGEVPERDFVGELFRALAPRYNRVLLAYSFGQDLRWKDVLISRLRPRQGERALDLACGTGLILARLAACLGDSRSVGVDLNRAMLLELRRGDGPWPVVQADAERLPFVSGSFDIVTAGYLLKYVDLDRFALEVARVLRPGGRFGGYDFSRPIRDTATGTLYSIFLHRILPLIGGSGGPGKRAWRTVFQFLPRIAETSGWELRVREALTAAGFGEVETRSTLGGAVTWVWARSRSL